MKKEVKPQKETGSEPHLELWRLVRMVARLLFRLRTEELAPLGISVRQAAMLSGVKALGDRATPANIARHQYRDPSSVSNIIIRMERMGLVCRSGDPAHGRRVRVTLTARGEELYKRSVEYARLREVFSVFGDEEGSMLLVQLRKLRKAARNAVGLRRSGERGEMNRDT